MRDDFELTPLANKNPLTNHFDEMRIVEVVDRSFTIMEARKNCLSICREAIIQNLGIELPGISKSSRIGDLAIRWIRPNTWMFEAPYSVLDPLETRLKNFLRDNCSIVEHSDAWCVFDLIGNPCITVLERLCNVDTKNMVSGDICSTRLEHLNCFIICQKEQTEFRIMGPRSAAGSVHNSIITATASGNEF